MNRESPNVIAELPDIPLKPVRMGLCGSLDRSFRFLWLLTASPLGVLYVRRKRQSRAAPDVAAA
jgi:hypothetical protein